MNKIKAIVFDLDGTLVDSLRDIAESINAALAQYGLPTHEVESYRPKIGGGIRKIVERSMPSDRLDLLDEVVAARGIYYLQHICDYTVLYPGIADLLEALREGSILVGVLSNKSDALVQPLVQQILPDYPFATIRGTVPDAPHKPDPTLLLEILAQWQISPDEALYVGDAEVDMQTANRAGVGAVGVAWGFRTREELRASGSRFLLEHPLDLLKLLDQ